MLKNIPETARTLLKAADIIRERGWWNGVYYFARQQGEETRTVCAAEALIQAADDHSGLYKPACAALVSVIGGQGWHDIPEWNDAPGRTAEEVIAALEAAAAQVAAETVG